jgi:transposase
MIYYDNCTRLFGRHLQMPSWELSGHRISSNLTINMKTPTKTALAAEVKNNNEQESPKAKQIFLGIDAHAQRHQVACKPDNLGIGPAQSFDNAGLINYVTKQLKRGQEVYAVYEAGPLGYGLYRALLEKGVKAYVCAPECLGQGKRKTNQIDARKLCSRLYSYVQGDLYALRVVQVPSPENEQRRAQSRQYDQLVQARTKLAAQGRALCLNQGYGSITGAWWRVRAYIRLKQELPEWMLRLLEVFRKVLLLLDEQIKGCQEELIQAHQEPLPKGFGAQSMEQLDREIGDYHRFKNRRQVGCFGGLVPQEYSTGQKQRLGSITKVGSPRVRRILVEMSWRVVRFQPTYGPVLKWQEVFCHGHGALKKKAIVAIARCLLIDIWKMRTGRLSIEQLHLSMMPQAIDDFSNFIPVHPAS